MLAEIGQHDGRAAILKAASGIELFELEEVVMITPRLLDERRQPLMMSNDGVSDVTSGVRWKSQRLAH